MYVCMYVCMCMYMFMYICMYVCMYVWYVGEEDGESILGAGVGVQERP